MADRVKGDWGEPLELKTPDIDYTGYTQVRILVKKPSGKKVVWTPTSVDTLYKVVSYEFEVGDLNESGVYRVAVEVTYGASMQVTTDPPFMLDVAEDPCH